jgi:ATP-binding cassette subfamily C protein CydCD
LQRLLGLVRPFALKTTLAFSSGVLYQAALIGVVVAGALVVGQVIRHSEIFWPVLLLALAVVATSVLSWVELWIAHDLAYQLLAEMRIDMYETLDPLSPGYLLRRRSGDLVSIISSDVETIEIFFAHTIAPAFVAVLVPGVVLVSLGFIGWPLAATLLPFLFLVAFLTLLPETFWITGSPATRNHGAAQRSPGRQHSGSPRDSGVRRREAVHIRSVAQQLARGQRRFSFRQNRLARQA